MTYLMPWGRQKLKTSMSLLILQDTPVLTVDGWKKIFSLTRT